MTTTAIPQDGYYCDAFCGLFWIEVYIHSFEKRLKVFTELSRLLGPEIDVKVSRDEKFLCMTGIPFERFEKGMTSNFSEADLSTIDVAVEKTGEDRGQYGLDGHSVRMERTGFLFVMITSPGCYLETENLLQSEGITESCFLKYMDIKAAAMEACKSERGLRFDVNTLAYLENYLRAEGFEGSFLDYLDSRVKAVKASFDSEIIAPTTIHT